MNRLHIAQVAHEVNRAYCASLGDKSQPSWDDAPQWQKDSALAGVDMHTANPDATPEQSHESWLAQKTADGWAWGEVKDAERKLHPCFLPYDQLPVEQKAKDYLFRGIVHALLALPKFDIDVEAIKEAAYKAAVEAEARKTVAVVEAAPSVFAQQVSNGVDVCYIGRSTWSDRLYGSGLTFEPEQQRRLPGTLASKLLRHVDLFKRVAEVTFAADLVAKQQEPAGQVTDGAKTEATQPQQEAAAKVDDTAILLEQAAKAKQEEDKATSQLQDVLDQVNAMDKDALKMYALEKFNQNIPKTLSVENMRQRVSEFVQAYGV